MFFLRLNVTVRPVVFLSIHVSNFSNIEREGKVELFKVATNVLKVSKHILSIDSQFAVFYKHSQQILQIIYEIRACDFVHDLVHDVHIRATTQDILL